MVEGGQEAIRALAAIPPVLDRFAIQPLMKKRYREAELVFRQVLTIAPTNSASLNYLGVSLHSQGKHKDAALAFKSALIINPNLEAAKSNTRSCGPGS